MGRRPRAWDPSCYYHLTPKGNNGQPIALDDVDRLQLLRLASVAFAACAARVFGYCVMTNHAHFVVRSGEQGLSRAMRDLFGGYTRWSNRRHGRKGHLLQNRCHVEGIESDAHLLVALAYVDLNPVRAGVVERPEDWRWSSYRAHVGLERPDPLLANGEFLRLFGAAPGAANAEYRRFVLSWQRNGNSAPALAPV